jgi:5-methylcytosine-specific restriction protein A
MASYFLLTWNPRRGEEEWPDMAQCLADSRDGRHVTLTWRCQNKSPLPGDRVFLLRQGVEPRGIMGSGSVLTAPYRREPGAPRIVNVRMDVLLDPANDGVLPISELRQRGLADVHWSTQASGIAIPDRATAELQRRWDAFLKTRRREIARWYSTEQYASALQQLGSILNEPLCAMLQAHLKAPGQCLSVNDLAAAAGYDTPQIVYSQYGRLGKALGELLKHDFRNETVFTRVLADDHRAESGDLHWTLDSALARALASQGLGDVLNADGAEWKAPSDAALITSLPEEIAEPDDLFEGAMQMIVVNRYERNYAAKQRCIEHYGARCVVCGLDFGDRYGPQMAGFIHVHHLTQLSTIGKTYRVDPIKDLRPICPNCHAVVHSRSPALTIEEAKRLIGSSECRRNGW